MSSVAIARRNQNLYRRRSRVSIGPVSIRFVMITLIAILALFYLHQITKTNIMGYRVNDLKKQKQELSDARRDLEIEAARLQSIRNLEESSVVADMVSEGNATYIKSR